MIQCGHYLGLGTDSHGHEQQPKGWKRAAEDSDVEG